MSRVEILDSFDVGGLEIPDTTGLPEAFVSCALFEDAGDGMVRVIRCEARHGELMPKMIYYTSAASILRDAMAAIEFVKKVMFESSTH